MALMMMSSLGVCACMQAGLAGMLGLAGSENVQGEDQKKLDILVRAVLVCFSCAVVVLSAQPNQNLIADVDHAAHVDCV